jgi:hypothetical protein
MIGNNLLQPTNCFVAISQTEVEESTEVWGHVPMLAEFFQFSQ